MVLKTPSAIARYEREKAETRARQLQAVEMRKSGYSFRKIAEEQGCTIKTALKRYNVGIKTHIPPELIDAVRATELDRFDALTVMNHKLMIKAYEAGDVDAFCKLEDRLLAVHDRRAKLVPIQVPQRLVVDATITEQTDQDRELADLLRKEAEKVEESIRFLNENAAP